MADLTRKFGTNTALTVTNLHSLATGSYWQSASIDNSTTKAVYAELFVTIKTTTSAASNKGSVLIYLAGSTDGGTDYAGGASGSEGSYTPNNNSNEQFRLVDVMPVDATDTNADTFKFWTTIDELPEKFSIVLLNNSGQALAADTNAVEYRLNQYSAA